MGEGRSSTHSVLIAAVAGILAGGCAAEPVGSGAAPSPRLPKPSPSEVLSQTDSDREAICLGMGGTWKEGEDGDPYCSNPGSPPSPRPQSSPEPQVELHLGDSPAKFQGQEAINYENSFTVCSAFTRKKIAKDLGIKSRHPLDLAEAYAEGWEEWTHQAVFEGCLHGIEFRRVLG